MLAPRADASRTGSPTRVAMALRPLDAHEEAWRTSKSAADSSGNRLPEDSHVARILVQAARDGDAAAVRRQLDEQSWPRGVLSRLGFTSGYTALGLACNRGHFAVAELLLQRGASPNCPICENGATPLMIAVVWDRLDMIALLLRHGASVGTLAGPRTAWKRKQGEYGYGAYGDEPWSLQSMEKRIYALRDFYARELKGTYM